MEDDKNPIIYLKHILESIHDFDLTFGANDLGCWVEEMKEKK